MSNATFDRPDLSAFARLDGLGLEVTGQRIWPDHAVLACRITGEDRWCRRCGCQGISRDTVVRRLAHEPCGWRPTILHVSVRRYRCQECAHVWCQDKSQVLSRVPSSRVQRCAGRRRARAILMPSPRNASTFSIFTTICSGMCFENFLMVIHSVRPQAPGTTQNNPLKTNGPKYSGPSTTTSALSRGPHFPLSAQPLHEIRNSA